MRLKLQLPKIHWFEVFLGTYYIWYFFPIARATFSATIYKYVFFSFFLLGMLLLLAACAFHSQGERLQLKVLIPVISYMLVMLLMTAFHVEDAALHIRVSFTFWGTILVYSAMGKFPDARMRFGTFLMILFILTAITSSIGVIKDHSVARILTYASNSVEEDYRLMKQNISSIYLYQCMVIAVPIYLYLIKKRKKVWLGYTLLILSAVVILNASFTISLFLMLAAVLICLLHTQFRWLNIILSPLLICAVLLVPWGNLLAYLAGLIDNSYISVRLTELSNSIQSGMQSTGDLALRKRLYESSLQTFFSHWMGVGPLYSYIEFENGIGYHSQMLDDFARYGIAGVAFYGVFLSQYYQLLKNSWAKIRMEAVAFPVTLLYTAFLILNLGFRSADESIFMLFILPVLPEVIHRRSAVKSAFEQKSAVEWERQGMQW